MTGLTELLFYVRSLIGTPPVGLEPIEYVFAGALLIILVSSAISMISGIFKWIGGM